MLSFATFIEGRGLEHCSKSHGTFSAPARYTLFCNCRLLKASIKTLFDVPIDIALPLTSTNRAGVAKLYAKPRFIKQIKISFNVLTLSIWFYGKSCKLFGNLIEHIVYKEIKFWLCMFIQSHSKYQIMAVSHSESYFVIQCHTPSFLSYIVR